MRTKFSKWLVGATLALIGSTITPAMADVWNKETRLEIKEPLEIPGHVLTPGTYIFKLADSTDRNIVQIFMEDGEGKQTFVATIFAVSAYRVQTPDKPMIELEERSAGTPQAIHAMFYPGARNGWEFVYPKSQRLEVAANLPAVEPPAPVPAATPVTLDPPELDVAEVPEQPVEFQVQEELASAPIEEPLFVALEEQDTRIFELPQTAGHSMTELVAGVTLLCAGLMIVLAARRRAEA